MAGFYVMSTLAFNELIRIKPRTVLAQFEHCLIALIEKNNIYEHFMKLSINTQYYQ